MASRISCRGLVYPRVYMGCNTSNAANQPVSTSDIHFKSDEDIAREAEARRAALRKKEEEAAVARLSLIHI